MKEIKYDKLYAECYKKLPKIFSSIWACVFGFITIVDLLDGTDLFFGKYHGILTAIVGNTAYLSAIFAFLIWVIIIAGGVLLLYYVSAVVISYKIRVLEELEKLNKSQSDNKSKQDED